METVAVPKGKVPAADASAACGRQPETGDVVAAANVKSRLFQTLSRRRSSDFGLEVAPMTFGGATLAFLIVSSFFFYSSSSFLFGSSHLSGFGSGPIDVLAMSLFGHLHIEPRFCFFWLLVRETPAEARARQRWAKPP